MLSVANFAYVCRRLNARLCGELPGALVIERNVLKWRFDPASDDRLAIADYDLEVIVVCQEGYTSSLAAAASLQDLGIHRTTDVIGGYNRLARAALSWSRA